MFKVYIIGVGLVGLVVVVCLCKEGFEVVFYESVG